MKQANLRKPSMFFFPHMQNTDLKFIYFYHFKLYVGVCVCVWVCANEYSAPEEYDPLKLVLQAVESHLYGSGDQTPANVKSGAISPTSPNLLQIMT